MLRKRTKCPHEDQGENEIYHRHWIWERKYPGTEGTTVHMHVFVSVGDFFVVHGLDKQGNTKWENGNKARDREPRGHPGEVEGRGNIGKGTRGRSRRGPKKRKVMQKRRKRRTLGEEERTYLCRSSPRVQGRTGRTLSRAITCASTGTRQVRFLAGGMGDRFPRGRRTSWARDGNIQARMSASWLDWERWLTERKKEKVSR